LGFRTLFIESPCRLSYSSGYLVVRTEDGTTKIHLSELSSVTLQTERVYISAYLLAELAKQKISLVVADEKHNPVGQYLPLYGAHNCAKRVKEQLTWGEPVKKRVWQRVVQEKIKQQASLLESRDCPNVDVLRTDQQEVRSGDTTNREAHAARIYFSSLFGPNFSRDVDNPINSALNYGYGVLLSLVNREIVSRGYLTQSGINHRNEYNQFNLACDLMEPFRPIVDWLVYDWVGGGFDSDTRKILVDMPNKSIFYDGETYKVGSVISLFVQDCLNALNKKILPSEIKGFDVE
jgi:CRISPR-associated protein Cas1